MSTINTNTSALLAHASISRAKDSFHEAMTRLSSGLRVNSASDDAAGMGITQKMTTQVMGLNQAIRNAADGKTMLDTLEGAHVEISNSLQRIRELAVQSANDTNSEAERGSISAEASQLIEEIGRIARSTTFNGVKVMDGSFVNKKFQIGPDVGQTLEFSVDSADPAEIGAYRMQSDVSIMQSGGVSAGKQIIISGYAGNTEITTTANMSAKEMATAVNEATPATGVHAIASSKAMFSNLSSSGKVSFNINGQPIGSVAISNASDLQSLRDAVNNKASLTGVTATMGRDSSEIILIDATGKNIAISNYEAMGTGLVTAPTVKLTALNSNGTADATVDVLTLDNTTPAALVVGQLTFVSAQAFSVNSATIDPVTNEVGFFANTVNSSSLEAVASIDLSSAESSVEALTIIDVAIEKISLVRGMLGGMSNRLDAAVSNLTTISVAMQAAKSQIVDADFAKESTALARGQILSQAATAMLAQANSSTENIISLLRGG